MVSPGIAMGRAFVYTEDRVTIPQYNISSGQVAYEHDRFLAAVEKSAQEILHLKDHSGSQMGETERKYLDSYLLMLKDPELTSQVRDQLRVQKKNVEWALGQVIKKMTEKLDTLDDDYLRERSVDIHDMARRILRHLLHQKKVSLANLAEEVILVAHNLMPSDAISVNKSLVLAIAMDMGGKTSHTAILARSFAIPAVLGLSTISASAQTGDQLIVDGNEGIVIINPDKATRKKYLSSREAWQRSELQLLDLSELQAETKDGKRLLLEANIEVPDEVGSVQAHGADGIGLYRSEFLYILPNRFPTEEEQMAAYRRVLESMKPKSVTIRTLDLGGDKIIPGVRPGGEVNPILGWRAVRFCLSRPDIFRIQLRALLRASMYGNLKIMFPMISGIEELNQVMEILEQVKDGLKAEGLAFKAEVPVGIMIEVPSAAFTSDILARYVNFFSIGTNDLIQYTIAVDRENERIAYLYEPFHLGVLRLIRLVIENAHRQGIPVGMCGEMAGDPRATAILLGLGLDEFSMSAIGIPGIKRIIRGTTVAEAEELAQTVLEMGSYQEIDVHVQEWMEKRFDFISH